MSHASLLLTPSPIQLDSAFKTLRLQKVGQNKIKGKKKLYSGSDEEWQDLNLSGIWHDEYLYVSTRRALRFNFLEKQLACFENELR